MKTLNLTLTTVLTTTMWKPDVKGQFMDHLILKTAKKIEKKFKKIFTFHLENTINS